jgi:hypothetical protein
MRALASVMALGCSLALSSTAGAEPNKRGLQVEGVIGAAACIPGRAPCHHENTILDGKTRPSFAVGGAIGIRPVKWFMIGALYRWGMFHPRYVTGDGVDYTWGGQHTAALMLRPIIPIWRLDLGLNIAPGFARQIFRRDEGKDRDYSQGFAFLVGPVVDIFVTDNFFLGASVDFIFSTQKKVCQRRGADVTCFRGSDQPMLTPTHQVLFGLHLGGVLF